MSYKPSRFILAVCTTALFFLPGKSPAQSDQPIGTWKAHLPYSAGIDVTESATDIVYASPEGLVFLDKGDLAPRFFSKVDGLSQANLQKIKYHTSAKTLLVAYSNGVIDLLKNGSVTTLRDIADFQSVPIVKSINHLYAYDNNWMLLSSDFGLSRLNVESGFFDFTVFTTGIEAVVHGACIYKGQIYMATSKGIYQASANPSANLADLSFWKRLGPNEDLPVSYSSRAIVDFNGQIYAAVNGELYSFDGEAFLPVYGEQGYSVTVLTAEQSHLLVGLRCDNECNSRMVAFDSQLNRTEGGANCTDRILQVIEDSQGRIWYGDEYRGFRYSEGIPATCQRKEFNTPFSKDVTEIAIHNNKVYVASGGVSDNYGYLFRDKGFYSLIDGQWDYYNELTVPLFKDRGLRDYFRVTVNQEDESVWVGTFWGGVIRYTDEEVEIFDKDNSSLQGITGDEQRTRIAGLAFDEDNNLWVSNYGAPRPISVRKPDGTWKSFDTPSGITFLSEVAIDRNGYKWFVIIGRAQGILVFDEGELDVDGDERYWIFTEANSALPTNTTNTVTVDLNGQVWVGTSSGPVVFANCREGIFLGECFGEQPIVDQDGDLDILLGTEDILTIAVDGGNRKWFGSRNGVFVQSSNAQAAIHRFTKSNSPLLDDLILDIAINPLDGEVFIGTAQGIISYRGEATAGGDSFSDDVYAFPNPVRPEYTGSIAIKGLASSALVKITDIRGRLVYETRAIGGQAIWDGNDYNGRKAHSGVYLVFSNTTGDSFNRPERVVTKITLIR